jgi:ABC-type transport system substrate-binding protein
MRVMKGRKSWFNVGTTILVANGNPRPWVVNYGYPTTGGIGYAEGIDPELSMYMVSGQTAERLFLTDPETRMPVPYLAEAWEWAENQSYLDITLRNDVKFHNGDNMTAEDVKFSFDSMLYDEERVGIETNLFWQRWFEHIEVIDTYEVRVHFTDEERPPRNDIAVQPVIIPKNYIEAVGYEAWAQEPVLTGPMKIVDWQADVYCHFEVAFPEEGHWYWGDPLNFEEPLPNYDELRIWCVVEPATRLAMLKAGELDLAQVTPGNIPDVKNDPDLTLVWSMHGCSWNVEFWDWANNESPLGDPDVRRAVSLAIDRVSISENVAHGSVTPWGSYWAPYSLGYEYRAPDPYDLVEAQSLLEDAGYPEGFNTYFNYPLDRELLSSAIIGSLANVGIIAQAQPYEGVTWATKAYDRELEGMGYMCFPYWGGEYYPEGPFREEVILWGAGGGPDPHPEVEAAFEAMLAADNEEQHIAAARAAAELVYDTLGYRIPVFAENFAFGYGPAIELWDPYPAASQQILMEVKYQE